MTSVAQGLLDSQAPWLTTDLANMTAAIGSMFAEMEQFTLDADETDDNESWAVLLDVDNAPHIGLAFLAQWIGERLPTGITDANARQWIKDGPNQRRGTPVSIARAAQRHLTGQQLVLIQERTNANGTADANGDHFNVYTYASQTPNPTQTLIDLMNAVPADMVLTYATLTALNWNAVEGTAGTRTWTSIENGQTWQTVLNQTPGTSVWSR